MYNQVIVGENSQTTMLNISLFFILFYFIFSLNIMFCVIYCTGVTLTMAWNGLDGYRCPAVPVHLLYIRVYIYIYIYVFSLLFTFDLILKELEQLYCNKTFSMYMSVYNHIAVLKLLLAIYQ